MSKRQRQVDAPSDRGRIGARVLTPMLPVVGGEAFDSPDHIFEVKWGGVRAIADVSGGTVRAHGQNLRELTQIYPELGVLARIVSARSATLDGEITAWSPQQTPTFELHRPRLLRPDAPIRRRRTGVRLIYHVFDVLEIDGRSLLDAPLYERRGLLHELVRPHRSVQVADFVRSAGAAFYASVANAGLEGIVAKERSSTYKPGVLDAAWQEIRAVQSDNFVVGGYSFGGGRRTKDVLASLLLGAYREGRLHFVGEVDVGCSDREARQLLELLTPLHRANSPFVKPPEVQRLFFWCRPQLACHVRYSTWTPGGTLRFPVFVTPRPDVPPDQCVFPAGLGASD